MTHLFANDRELKFLESFQEQRLNGFEQTGFQEKSRLIVPKLIQIITTELDIVHCLKTT